VIEIIVPLAPNPSSEKLDNHVCEMVPLGNREQAH
jgi:hypothetical protein